jgi:hypothetical protein
LKPEEIVERKGAAGNIVHFPKEENIVKRLSVGDVMIEQPIKNSTMI